MQHSPQADADAVMLRSLLTGSGRGWAAALRREQLIRPPNRSEDGAGRFSRGSSATPGPEAWDEPTADQPPPSLQPEL